MARRGRTVGTAAAVVMAAGVVAGAVAVVAIAATAEEDETRARRVVGAVTGIVAVAIVIRIRVIVADAGITRCRITHSCDRIAVGVNHTRREGETAGSGTGKEAE